MHSISKVPIAYRLCHTQRNRGGVNSSHGKNVTKRYRGGATQHVTAFGSCRLTLLISTVGSCWYFRGVACQISCYSSFTIVHVYHSLSFPFFLLILLLSVLALSLTHLNTINPFGMSDVPPLMRHLFVKSASAKTHAVSVLPVPVDPVKATTKGSCRPDP